MERRTTLRDLQEYAGKSAEEPCRVMLRVEEEMGALARAVRKEIRCETEEIRPGTAEDAIGGVILELLRLAETLEIDLEDVLYRRETTRRFSAGGGYPEGV